MRKSVCCSHRRGLALLLGGSSRVITQRERRRHSDGGRRSAAQPGTFTDSLTEILRSGARALLTQAVEAEVGDFLHRHADLKTEAGRRRLVRHGHLPEREIMTGIGPVARYVNRAYATVRSARVSASGST